MASGDTLLTFSPYNNEPPVSNFATLDVRNNHPVLDFDSSTNESAIFSAVMPRSYAGTTGITTYIHFSTVGTSTATVDWDVAFERIGDGQLDIDGDSFAAVNSVDDTRVPTTDGHVDIVNITFTDGADMDSVAVGELFRMKITRDASSDDFADDAELHAIEIKET